MGGGAEPTRYDPMFDRAATQMKPRTRLVLCAGFGSVLALMVLAGLDSIRVTRGIESTNSLLTQSYLQRNRILDRLRTRLFLSGTVVRDYLTDTNPIAASQHLSDLEKLRGETDSTLQSYSAHLAAGERTLFAELKASLGAYWEILAPALRWSAEQRRSWGYSFLRQEVLPRRTAMLALADKIDAVNDQLLIEGERNSANLFNNFRWRITVVLAMTVGLGLALAWVTIFYILRLEKDARIRYQEILRAQGELQRLSARLVEAQEQERRSVSRELHDEIGQSLSAVLVDLGNLAAITPPENEEARRLLGTAKKLAEESVHTVRNMALLLRPSMLDDFGLVPALHWQAREVSRRTGVRVDLVAEEVADELPEEHRTCVYRVVQEALHNCSRHAAAQTVHILVRQESDRLLLTVQDDGKGFDPRQSRGLGLLGMEERVKHLGGAFQVNSKPGRGTLLKIELPLAARQEQVEKVSA